MFRHISLLAFVPEATTDQVTAIVDALSGLPAVIPELRAYHLGRDAGLADGNYDLAIVADFDDVDGYRAYADHPRHQQILAEQIRPILRARAAVQHELG